jgi:hypothetical protein
MDDDDVNLRDYDAKLYVGSLEIASIEEDHVSPELLSVFTDEMYRSRAGEFAAPGPVIADRLGRASSQASGRARAETPRS